MRNDSAEDCEGFAPGEEKAVRRKESKRLLGLWPERFVVVEDPNSVSPVPENIDEMGGYRNPTIEALKKVYENGEAQE